MKTRRPEPLPPRLGMEPYLDFVEESFRERNVKLAHRQKELEERITKPFTLVPPQVAVEGR
ncbi:MAG: hypothetical protein ISS35_03535 [Kiritimatiellae bacterium]|nr:hypothetical protein [Kiritimatiellia bacterium]